MVEERKWDPEAKPQIDGRVVYLQVAASEMEIRRQVKGAGGKWHPQLGVWELPYEQVVTLHLERRIAHVQKSI